MEKHLKSHFSKLLNSAFTSSCRKKSISDVTNQPENNPRLIDLFSPKPQPHIPPTPKPKTHLSRQKKPHFPTKNTSNSASPNREKRVKTDRKRKTHLRKRPKSLSFSSVTDNTYYNWWTSDEEEEEDDEKQSTLFSRRSFSSFSGDGDRRLMDGVVVTKESSDPHEDFRVSMVDMIVEKGIFGVEELENLVECFVKLNREEHHKIIFEVFAEIWESLVSDI
uniref:Transcription repressor n=1 Tax=Tanacetum cinerariifolium TaxID=118510 RepID=A0A6L2L9U9_TANCI|nr:hypothetical protein [Tanacetum cinerariifolium]